MSEMVLTLTVEGDIMALNQIGTKMYTYKMSNFDYRTLKIK